MPAKKLLHALLFVFCCLTSPFVTAADFISERDAALANQTYGALQVNKSVSGGKISIAGKIYDNGLGTHAVSEIPVTVPSGKNIFSGAVGVDDGAGSGRGSVTFRILSGNRVLWESPEMKAGDAAVSFSVTLPSPHHRKIFLQADDLGNNAHDHANWVDLRWSGDASSPSPQVTARIFQGDEFGITANTRADQTAAFNKAIDALRDSPGSTLRLAKGTYHFWRTNAFRRHFHISNHDQPTWHPIGISLVDLNNATLDGQGSTFVFHGQMLLVLIQDSEKISLKNIAIDFERPHHSQALITQIEPDAFEVTVDQKLYPHEIRDGWIVHKGEGWEARDWGVGIVFDGVTREIVTQTGDFSYRGKLTALGDGHYRIARDLSKTKIKSGDRITLRHSSRPHPGICIYRAQNTTLENVNIHQSAGMALLAQRSENITILGGGVNLASGTDRYFTSNADATHFSNCRGLIRCENGLYEGMMDDAINVHATCLRIEEKINATTLRARYVHGQSVGFEVVLPGESIRFIRAKHLELTPSLQVKSVRRIDTNNIEIELASAIPDGIGKGDALENADWAPAVKFRGNTVRNNRARGTLFTTPKEVLVEKNTFDHSSGSAILLAGDANGWYESGACDGVFIRNNVFRNNLTSRYQFTEAIISIYPEVPDLVGQKTRYHRNVQIVDNVFETFDVPLVFAISTDGLIFRNNRIRYNTHYNGWKKEPFIFKHCENIVIENNDGISPVTDSLFPKLIKN